MNTPLFLAQPAMVSSLGEGVQAHLDGLFTPHSPLRYSNRVFSEQQISASPRFFGEVNLCLRPFEEDVPALHRSRNNQLLWHCLAQIEPLIEQCIEHFGRSRIAVVMGTSTTGVDENIPTFKAGAESNDWSKADFNQQQQLFSAPSDFIAYQYGLTGLTYGISTACTSGARALISAARLLKNNLCDAVICGGVDTLSPLTISGFGSLSVLSEQKANPFSVHRDGINIGEAATVFVMTREVVGEHNVALLGYGSSSDAYHMSSPHPEGEGAITAFHRALQQANLTADQIGWINLHGTGTIHNDQMESKAVADVFGLATPCTTTKPYTGHTLGAAGALEAGILWSIISRQYNPQGKLPAQLWDQQPDPTLPAINITNSESQWQQNHRIGASSSFAFGGNNAVLIMGECDD